MYPCASNMFISFFFVTFRSSSESPFINVFTAVIQKNDAVAQCQLSERQAHKNIKVSSFTLLTSLALWDFWLFLKGKMTMKDKCFKFIQDMNARRLKTHRRRTSTTTSESSKNIATSVFQVRGNILKMIDSNMSFTIINLLLNINYIIWLYFIKRCTIMVGN